MKCCLFLAAVACIATPAMALEVYGTGPARVIDGDTVVVAGTTVPLKGVDAAERGTERGENARRLMMMIVTGPLSCQLTGEKTHRREVGYCSTMAWAGTAYAIF